MANLKEVRTRIASVSSTQQITSAMKMVSAAKFRRAQNAIIGMRPYSNQLSDIVSNIDTGDGILTPYHEVRKLEHVLLVVVTSNKGLCGAFNSNVIKQAQSRIDYYRASATADQPAALSMITIGKRCTEYFSKRFDNIVGTYDEMLDNATFDAVASLSDSIMQQFCDKNTISGGRQPDQRRLSGKRLQSSGDSCRQYEKCRTHQRHEIQLLAGICKR